MDVGTGPPFDPDYLNGLVLSSLRGLRNGIVCGVRIRLPYVIQALAYVIIFRDQRLFKRVNFVVKQGLSHGRNLGIFVFIYKSLCWILRKVGIRGGIESWIAGFIGGYIGFGENEGVVGSVNNQICLYLLARGIEAFLRTLVKKNYLPKSADVKTSKIGFRCFAGFSLALILYMTEYQGDMLSPSFRAVMHNLYYESNQGSLLPRELLKFFPLIALVTFSIFGELISKKYGLENIMSKFP